VRHFLAFRYRCRFFTSTLHGSKEKPGRGRARYPSLEAARAAALSTLGEIARDELPDGDERDFSASIRDESGRVLLIARLTLTIEKLD
jgi:hypothetical protein